jgi:hypothetical protein
LEHLCDLALFHEFNNILCELIERFTNACQQKTDLQKFSKLAQEFYYGVTGGGFNALQPLRNTLDFAKH